MSDLSAWGEAFDLENVDFKPKFEDLTTDQQLQYLQFKALMAIGAEISTIGQDELRFLREEISENFKKLRIVIENLPING